MLPMSLDITLENKINTKNFINMKGKIAIAAIILFFVIYFVNAFHYFNEDLNILQGRTLYVGGSGPGNYSSIQAAIDDANPGDTIFIYDDSSPYKEWLKIDKENITLIGENRNTTIIENPQDTAVYIHGNYVKFYNLTIKGCSTIYDEKGNNLIISNCSIYSSSRSNSLYLDCKNALIKDSILNDVLISSSNPYIANNTFIRCKMGYVGIEKEYQCKIANCNLSSLGLWDAEHCTIINNRFRKEGIFIKGGNDYWLHEIRNNTLRGKLILYLYNTNNFSIKNQSLGEIIIANCRNFSIKNVTILNDIMVGYSNDASLSHISQRYVWLDGVSNFSLTKINPPKISIYNSDNYRIHGIRNGYIDMENCKRGYIYNCSFQDLKIKGKENNFFNCAFIGPVEVYSSYTNFSYCNIFYHGIMCSSPHITIYKCNFSYNDFALVLSSDSKVLENTFYKNNIGIRMDCSKNDTIQRNWFIKNKKGIYMGIEMGSHSGGNKINYNHFVKNDIHARIDFWGKAFSYNNWNENYWDNWIPSIPKPILCSDYILNTYFFSLLNVDWHPLVA